MTYPWAAGEVLTAADLNAYAGLVPVKKQTITAGVASVEITSAFSAQFDTYRVVINNIRQSADNTLLMRMGATTTGYYGSYYYDSALGGAAGTARRNNGANWYLSTSSTVNGTQAISFDIFQPFLAARTAFHSSSFGSPYSEWAAGVLDNATSYTSFVLLRDGAAATLQGGTVYVYGYNLA